MYTLADAKSWGEIADFGNDYKNWLKKFLPIGDTMTIDDAYHHVFNLIDSKELSNATITYITPIFKNLKSKDENKVYIRKMIIASISKFHSSTLQLKVEN